MNYEFKLPIGDFGVGGHGDCVWFTLRSNKSVEELRKIYKKTRERLGQGIDGSNSICGSSGERNINKEDLTRLGLDPNKYFTESQITLGGEEYIEVSPRDMTEIFVDFIYLNNTDVELFIIPDNLPIFTTFGGKIGCIGYGLFD